MGEEAIRELSELILDGCNDYWRRGYFSGITFGIVIGIFLRRALDELFALLIWRRHKKNESKSLQES